MEKKIRFVASVDTQELDRTVDQIRGKLDGVSRQSMQARDRAAKAGLATASTPQERNQVENDEKRQRRELDGFIRQQIRDQERLGKELNAQLATTRQLKKEREDLIKLGKSDAEVAERLSRAHQQANQTRGSLGATNAGINASLDARQQLMANQPQGWDRIRRAYQMGGVGGAARAFGRQPGFAAGVGASVLGGVAGLVSAGASMYGQYNELQGQINSNQGSAVSNLAAPGVAAMRGQGLQEAFWSPERAAAMQEAQTTQGGRRTAAYAGFGGRLGAAMASGAGAGALGGAFFGGIGAIPGAIGGAAVGGAGYLAHSMMGGGQDQAMLGQMLPGKAGAQYGRQFESMMQAQQAGFGSSYLEDLKKRNPMKTEMINQYTGSAMRDLGVQRQFGLSDSDMYGGMGMLQRGASQGFSMDQTLAASGSIMSAGGGTRNATGNSLLANRLMRDRDMTNAGSVIGTLGGAMGGTQATESATVKVLAEGVRLGLDGSDYVEENRRFTQMASQIIAGAGARDANSAGNIASSLSGFATSRTTQGIDAAGTAYRAYQSVTGEKSGARMSIKAAYMGSDPALSKLDRNQKNSILGMSQEQIQAGGAEIEAMAAQAGVSLPEFQEAAMDMTRHSVNTLNNGGDQMRDKLSKMAKGKTKEEAMADPKFRKGLGEYVSQLKLTSDIGGMTALQQESFAMGDIMGDIMGTQGQAGPAAEAAAMGTPSPRARDAEIAGTDAKAQMEYLKQIASGFAEVLEKANGGLGAFTESVLESTRKISQQDVTTATQGAESNRAARDAARVQPSTGTPRR